MPQIRKTHNISSYGKNCLKSLYLSRLRNSTVFYAIWQKGTVHTGQCLAYLFCDLQYRDRANVFLNCTPGQHTCVCVNGKDAHVVAVLIGCQQEPAVRSQNEVTGDLTAAGNGLHFRKYTIFLNPEHHQLVRAADRYIQPLSACMQPDGSA